MTPEFEPKPDWASGGPATKIDERPVSAENITSGYIQMFRFNAGKVPLNLVPSSYDRYCAYALWYGAVKYTPNNWRKAGRWTEVADSLKRHFDDWREGEDFDHESKLPHLCHMAANLAFLIEFFDKGIGTDDRFRYADSESGSDKMPGRQLSFAMPEQRQSVPGVCKSISSKSSL